MAAAGEEAPICTICLEELAGVPCGVSRLECGHSFCDPCLAALAEHSGAALGWTRSRGVRVDCPNCRVQTRWVPSTRPGSRR